MFNVLINAWRVKDLRRKIIYVLLVVGIYRLGSHVLLPNIDPAAVMAATGANTDQSFYAAIVGGGFASIFTMGIGPFITASIIMQLLTVAIPKLEQIQKEGQEGRKKIEQYTRRVAVALALLQGSGTIYSYRYLFKVNTVLSAAAWQKWLVYITATLAIVTGTMFIMWLSEMLTEKGIGNGSSFIIFANILSGLPNGVRSLYYQASGGDIWGYVSVCLVLILFVAIIAFVVFVQDGERRIPVQYSKKMVGRQMYGGQSSYIPIKVNIAGVMSIIFSISLLQFPSTIYQLWRPEWLRIVVDALNISKPIGAVLYMFLIFCFTFFYTSFAINPIEMAENMKKNGGFIPGIRPGKPTSDYVQRTVDRLSWIGAFFYVAIAMIPVLLQWIFRVNISFGGTTLLIVTGVALEIVKQLESQLLMRHYKGFLSE